MKQATLLILAAGMGSRYGGLKQLDRLGPGGGTVLDYSVFDALRAGFSRVVFVTRRELADAFEDAFVSRWRAKADCALAFQELSDVPAPFSVPAGREKPWGTAHAIRAARHEIAGPFAVINADDFYGANAFRALADFLLRPAAGGARHAMVAYRLENTLSENGTVSRGVCRVTDAGMLSGIEEFTKIARGEDGTMRDAATGTELPDGTPVSMNCWGFDAGLFDALERDFASFLASPEAAGNPKAEFTIPSVVDGAIARGDAVEVLPCDAKWSGVTYQSDRPAVVARLAALTASGEYPADLWA